MERCRWRLAKSTIVPSKCAIEPGNDDGKENPSINFHSFRLYFTYFSWQAFTKYKLLSIFHNSVSTRVFSKFFYTKFNYISLKIEIYSVFLFYSNIYKIVQMKVFLNSILLGNFHMEAELSSLA